MDSVKVYKAEGIAFDEREMSLTELPPIPSEYQDRLVEAGGYCDEKPNVRIVSGLDPDLVEFYGGKWWRKYAFREHRVNEYTVWHKPDGTKKILSPKEAEVMGKMKNRQGLLLPVVDRQTIEHGIPRYFVEYYKPPELFGDPELWEQARFDPQEDGTMLDLMGPFPSEGMYETWFSIEEPVEENGEIVQTKFRALDDIVMELILAKIEEAKARNSAAQQHTETRQEVNREYLEHKEKIKEDIKDIVSEHVDRLVI